MGRELASPFAMPADKTARADSLTGSPEKPEGALRGKLSWGNDYSFIEPPGTAIALKLLRRLIGS